MRHDAHLQAQERSLGRKQPCRHLDLRLPASRTQRRYISVGYGPQSVTLCDSSPSKAIQTPQSYLLLLASIPASLLPPTIPLFFILRL